MVLKTYSFLEGIEPAVYEKSFKKYLNIALSPGVRKYTNLNNINECDFSYQKANTLIPENLKKYKIRITSKKTGKKLDINLDFNKTINNQYLKDNVYTGDESLQKEEQDKNIKNTQVKIQKAGEYDSFESELPKATGEKFSKELLVPPVDD